MEMITLEWNDSDGRPATTTFSGILLGEAKDSQLHDHAGVAALIAISWKVYRTVGGMYLFHEYHQLVGTPNWNGDISVYRELSELLADMHKRSGRGNPLAKLRSTLLAKSLTESKTTADDTPGATDRPT